MPDKKEVLKALVCRVNDPVVDCTGCPYNESSVYWKQRCDFHRICRDALALLKEQEPVEPYMDYDGHDVWRCGNCGATIFHIEHTQADEDWKSYAKFCRQCGKAVKWNG